MRNTLVGAVTGATLGLGYQYFAAANAATLAAAAAGAGAGGGLTGKIVAALEDAGPEMSARMNAVFNSVPSNLKILMTTDEETGAVTISGGAGDRARQIILNIDGTSAVRAFDTAKNVWNTVKEIKPQ